MHALCCLHDNDDHPGTDKCVAALACIANIVILEKPPVCCLPFGTQSGLSGQDCGTKCQGCFCAAHQGLRVLDNACETAAEHAAEHAEDPLDVWTIVERSVLCTPWTSQQIVLQYASRVHF